MKIADKPSLYNRTHTHPDRHSKVEKTVERKHI